jgi:hypothetical protein
MAVEYIISGDQTGVDRAVLRFLGRLYAGDVQSHP